MLFLGSEVNQENILFVIIMKPEFTQSVFDNMP